MKIDRGIPTNADFGHGWQWEADVEDERPVFFVSDHTGITAEVVGQSLLSRFEGERFRYVTRPFVDTPEKADRVVAEIAANGGSSRRPIAFLTITDPEVARRLTGAPALALDILNPHLAALQAEFGEPPATAVGRYHRIVDPGSYQTRMDAVDFALATDDGLGTHNYERADIILVGVSRAGKTPTCLFLGMQYGIRASNYPLAEDDFEAQALPRALAPHRDKLFGLTIEPRRLQQIRQLRRPGSGYASLEQCEYEVRQSERLFGLLGITVLNTTTSSIEEIAATVMQQANLKRRMR
jgi:regulator of PEP synthase PpsR (kinase-PPPase family)